MWVPASVRARWQALIRFAVEERCGEAEAVKAFQIQVVAQAAYRFRVQSSVATLCQRRLGIIHELSLPQGLRQADTAIRCIAGKTEDQDSLCRGQFIQQALSVLQHEAIQKDEMPNMCMQGFAGFGNDGAAETMTDQNDIMQIFFVEEAQQGVGAILM